MLLSPLPAHQQLLPMSLIVCQKLLPSILCHHADACCLVLSLCCCLVLLFLLLSPCPLLVDCHFFTGFIVGPFICLSVTDCRRYHCHCHCLQHLPPVDYCYPRYFYHSLTQQLLSPIVHGNGCCQNLFYNLMWRVCRSIIWKSNICFFVINAIWYELCYHIFRIRDLIVIVFIIYFFQCQDSYLFIHCFFKQVMLTCKSQNNLCQLIALCL